MKRLLGAAIALAVTTGPATADRYSDAETAHLLGQYDKARRILLPLAEKGNKRAQYLIGRQYQLGQGVPQDLVQAYVWYGRAARQGHVEAGLFQHLLVSKWKMSDAQVARAKAILDGKSPSAVASIKPTTPTTPTAAKPPVLPPAAGDDGTKSDRKAPTAKRSEDDFGPISPDPRGWNEDNRGDDGGKSAPVDKDPPGIDPPRPTAKAQPKPLEPTDDELIRREREADRKADELARRRQEAAERQEIEARRRAEALRREMEESRRAPFTHEDDDDGPPIQERWAPPPRPSPYAYNPFFMPYPWGYYPPPARIYAPYGYRAPWPGAQRRYGYGYRWGWAPQRRGWRGKYRRNYGRRY